jgi:hypothetical protein
MGLFTRRRQSLALTPEAVATVLACAGFRVAALDDGGHPLTEGFQTWTIPVAAQDRIGVHWWADAYAQAEEAALGECADALADAGYQAELVAELSSDYLVVWLEGEF